MRQIAVINQKGGVGKTTSCANLGAAVAATGQSVLLIDLDPQAHLTMHLGIEPDSEKPSIYNVLTDRTPITEAVAVVRDNLHIVPSHIDLAAAEMELISVVGREVVLRDALAGVSQRYDLIMIDCPPSLGVLTINGLAAMHEVLVPMQPHFLALQGLGKLLETIRLIKDRINPHLRVSGVILCMYEAGTRLAGEVTADLSAFLDASRGSDAPWADARVFQTIVRRNIKLAECPSHGLAIYDYAPESNGAKDYAALAAELLQIDADSIQQAMTRQRAMPQTPANVEAPAVESDDTARPAGTAAEDTTPPPLRIAGREAFGPDDVPEHDTISLVDDAYLAPKVEMHTEPVAAAMETAPPEEPANAAGEVANEEPEPQAEQRRPEQATDTAPTQPAPRPPARMVIPIAYEDDDSESLKPSFETRRGR
jgi:chromosome partitioning protein